MGQQQQAQSTDETARQAEQFFQQYQDYAFVEMPGVYGTKPNDQSAAAKISVKALLDRHEENMKRAANNQQPYGYPDPEQLAQFYKFVTGG
jgi:hypothetical protein